MSGVSVMENRGKKKRKERNRAEIVKVKGAAGGAGEKPVVLCLYRQVVLSLIILEI